MEENTERKIEYCPRCGSKLDPNHPACRICGASGDFHLYRSEQRQLINAKRIITVFGIISIIIITFLLARFLLIR